MKEIKIEIEDIALREMDIEQPIAYAVLKFAESHLTGYFVHRDQKNLNVYLGGQVFNCKNNPYNIELLESILKGITV